MCPPRREGDPGIPLGSPGCPDPFVEAGGWWTVVAVDVAVLVGIVAVAALALRDGRDEPVVHGGAQARVFGPRRRMLLLSGALLAAAMLLVALAPVVHIPLVGTALALAAFLLGGSALRPRGRLGRGLALGGTTYLALGIAVSVTATAVVHRVVWTALLPLQMLFWPDLLAASVAGAYTLG